MDALLQPVSKKLYQTGSRGEGGSRGAHRRKSRLSSRVIKNLPRAGVRIINTHTDIARGVAGRSGGHGVALQP